LKLEENEAQENLILELAYIGFENKQISLPLHNEQNRYELGSISLDDNLAFYGEVIVFRQNPIRFIGSQFGRLTFGLRMWIRR
ncbi:MAG: hypothetical protein AAFN10_25270, partial [Bacteroidota bacterium]